MYIQKVRQFLDLNIFVRNYFLSDFLKHFFVPRFVRSGLQTRRFPTFPDSVVTLQLAMSKERTIYDNSMKSFYLSANAISKSESIETNVKSHVYTHSAKIEPFV